MPELEDPQFWENNFARNQGWIAAGHHQYNTPLTAEQEAGFKQWLKANNVPFNPALPYSDYDMRGFWKAMNSGNPIAVGAIDPNDKKLHYPDYWKTPYSATFSAESQWANPLNAPVWKDDQYTSPSGQVLWNDKTQKWVGPNAPWQPSDKSLLRQSTMPR